MRNGLTFERYCEDRIHQIGRLPDKSVNNDGQTISMDYLAHGAGLGKNVGLNADFFGSAWLICNRINGDYYLCDNEDGTLSIIIRSESEDEKTDKCLLTTDDVELAIKTALFHKLHIKVYVCYHNGQLKSMGNADLVGLPWVTSHEIRYVPVSDWKSEKVTVGNIRTYPIAS